MVVGDGDAQILVGSLDFAALEALDACQFIRSDRTADFHGVVGRHRERRVIPPEARIDGRARRAPGDGRGRRRHGKHRDRSDDNVGRCADAGHLDARYANLDKRLSADSV